MLPLIIKPMHDTIWAELLLILTTLARTVLASLLILEVYVIQ